jgi:hypothetical protein
VAVTLWLPLGCSAPFHPPLAVHDVAFVDVHVSATGCPTNAFAVAGVSVTVGGGVLGPGDGLGELPPPQAPSRRATMATEPRQILEDIAAPWLTRRLLRPERHCDRNILGYLAEQFV